MAYLIITYLERIMGEEQELKRYVIKNSLIDLDICKTSGICTNKTSF